MVGYAYTVFGVGSYTAIECTFVTYYSNFDIRSSYEIKIFDSGDVEVRADHYSGVTGRTGEGLLAHGYLDNDGTYKVLGGLGKD